MYNDSSRCKQPPLALGFPFSSCRFLRPLVAHPKFFFLLAPLTHDILCPFFDQATNALSHAFELPHLDSMLHLRPEANSTLGIAGRVSHFSNYSDMV